MNKQIQPGDNVNDLVNDVKPESPEPVVEKPKAPEASAVSSVAPTPVVTDTTPILAGD